MLGDKIDICVFDNHINHNYPTCSPVHYEWQRIKNDIVEALKPSTNTDYAAALNIYKLYLYEHDGDDAAPRYDLWLEERLHSEEPNVA
jgi:hypothetical protein